LAPFAVVTTSKRYTRRGSDSPRIFARNLADFRAPFDQAMV
jgi:hypothetical protein